MKPKLLVNGWNVLFLETGLMFLGFFFIQGKRKIRKKVLKKKMFEIVFLVLDKK